jgi:rhodanese-related sulfurtransferase
MDHGPMSRNAKPLHFIFICFIFFLFASDKAPSLKKFAGDHLEADEYHEAMQDPEAVIIDVRNAYESAIGNFQPPKGGATLIDPKMRNSIEFPKWLNSEETQKKLTGKKVLVSDPLERNGVSVIFCRCDGRVVLTFAVSVCIILDVLHRWHPMRESYSSSESNVDSKGRAETQRGLPLPRWNRTIR